MPRRIADFWRGLDARSSHCTTTSTMCDRVVIRMRANRVAGDVAKGIAKIGAEHHERLCTPGVRL
jgi:hypothetical protein